MPFENINFGLLRPQTQVQDPGEIMAKVLQIKNMQTQGQLGQMQLQKEQQGLQDASEFKTRYGVSPGVAQAAQKMQLGALENEKAQHESQKAHLEAVNSLNQQQLSVYQSALDALDKDPTQGPAIHQATLAKTVSNAKTLFPQLDTSKSDDPPGFQSVDQQKAWLQNKISQSMTMDQRLKQADMAIKQNAAKSELGKFAADMGSTIDDPKVQAAWLKLHPKASMSLNMGGVATPEGSQNYAERLVKGLEDWPSTVSIRTDPTIRQGLELARQMDPSFNASTHKQRQQVQKAFTTGKPADTINALNTGMGHLSELSDLAEKLNNSSIVGYNTVANWAAKNTGDPIVTAFQTTKKAVADEVTRVWRGTGGSEQDVQQALGNLSENLSPAQLRANIFQLTKLMASKQKALEDQYQKGMGKFGDLEILDPEAKAALGKIQERAGVKATASGNVPKVGTVMDGHVFLGGDPADPKSWKKQ